VAAATLGLAAAVLIFGLLKPEPAPSARPLHVLNCLGAPVTVEIRHQRQELPPGGRVALEMPDGPAAPVAAWSPENLIERHDRLPEPSPGQLEAAGWESGGDRGWRLVYNVAGACPLVEWEAVYARRASDGPARERLLGAPVFHFTRADVILEEPPKAIRVQGGARTRIILSALAGAHPRRLLETAPEADRGRVIRVQARWGRPEAPWTPIWLALLAEEGGAATEVLAGRLEDFPLDPLTNELFLGLADRPAAEAWCGALFSMMASGPDGEPAGGPGPESGSGSGAASGAASGSSGAGADQAFLSALCLPPGRRAEAMAGLRELYPEHPWLNRSEGWERLDRKSVV
jgi:hypothetical protein